MILASPSALALPLMTSQPTQPPSAHLTFAPVHAPQSLLARYEEIAQENGVTLPPTLLIELHSFLKRNRILGTTTVLPEEDICPHCMKAHFLVHAQSHRLPSQQQRLLQKKIPGKIGHGNNYLDGGELKKTYTP